jgi:hypothetical protein
LLSFLQTGRRKFTTLIRGMCSGKHHNLECRRAVSIWAGLAQVVPTPSRLVNPSDHGGVLLQPTCKAKTEQC